MGLGPAELAVLAGGIVLLLALPPSPSPLP